MFKKINNFEIAREYVRHTLGTGFQTDYYLKFEAIIRKKDDKTNKLVVEHQGSHLIHSWVIRCLDDLDRFTGEMVELCNVTGARLYMTIEKKDIKLTVANALKDLTNTMDNIVRGNAVSVKDFMTLADSTSSRRESSAKRSQRYLIDVDNTGVTYAVMTALKKHKISYFMFESPNGAHFVTARFDKEAVLGDLLKNPEIEFKPNALAVIYYDDEEYWRRI